MTTEPERDPLLLDHEVDGISELDNNLPRWWVWLFYLSILFSVAYTGFYHVLGLGALQATEYEREVALHLRRQALLAQQSSGDLAPTEATADPAILAEGRQVYAMHCAVCHGAQGQGMVGPNLADDFFLHGATYADTMHTIQEGVLAKGMIAWKKVLRPAQTAPHGGQGSRVLPGKPVHPHQRASSSATALLLMNNGNPAALRIVRPSSARSSGRRTCSSSPSPC
jgi:cytochrome c oxidase cbb3-type subunit III